MSTEHASVRDDHRRRAHSKSRALLDWSTWLIGWVAAIVMLATASAWTVGFAPWPPLQWINAFTGYFYLPVYALLLFSIGAGCYRLACCFAAIGAWHAMVVLPTVLPVFPPSAMDASARAEAAAAAQAIGAQTVRVFYANVGKTSREFEAMFDELRDSDADVLVLTEFTTGWHNRFNATELPAEYPNHIHLTEYTPAATGVYSRLPLVHDDRMYQAKRVVVRTSIAIGDKRLGLYAIHAPRPVRSPLHKYDEFWGIVRQELAKQRGPLLLVGDFNATPYSLIHRELTGRFGLRDCHALCGRGRAVTWPNGMLSLPPIRIDHALVSPEVECLQIAEGAGRGSDHKPLIVDLLIPGPAPSSAGADSGVARRSANAVVSAR